MKHKKSSINKRIWQTLNLDEVLITAVGGTPETGNKAYWDRGEIPWLNSGALKEAVITKPTTYITELGLLNSAAKVFPKNSVLVALTGATLGKIGLLDFNCSTNQSIVAVYPSKYILPKFLFYYLLTKREEFLSKAKGVAQPHINKSIVEQISIPIAPIEHQREIVDFLDSVFNQVSDLRKEYERLVSLENDAFQNFISSGDKPYPGVAIGGFCSQRSEKIGNGWRGKRLIGVSNEFGISDLRVGSRVTFEKYKVVYPGDFIYNPMRINIGSIAIYDGQEEALTSPDYIVFKIDHTLSSRFLLKYLKSDLGIEQINQNTRGSVRSRLYFSYLAKMTIPFCGEKCHVKAEQILTNFENMKRQAQDALANVDGIINRAFEKAFSEKTYSRIKFKTDADELVKLLKREKELNVEIFKKSNKLNLSMNRRPKPNEDVSLLELLSERFGDNRFTFEAIRLSTKLPYEALRDQVFEMIDSELILEFDKKEERMYFKLKKS